jgi:chloride channel 2
MAGSERHVEEVRSQWLLGDSAKWVTILLLLSALSSVMALAMEHSVKAVRDWLFTYHSDNPAAFMFIRVALVAAGVLITQLISPIAVGSGIPQVKTVLAGFHFPAVLSRRTLIAKSLGVVLAIGSGMPVGAEGPFIHCAACIAQLCLDFPSFQKFNLSPDLRQQVISAACAVGVSSAFGAPIGGVLFSVEATSHYYLPKYYTTAFFSAVFGAFVVGSLAMEDTSFLPDLKGRSGEMPYQFWEFLPFFVLALVSGFAAGLFTQFFVFVTALRRKVEFKTKFIFRRFCMNSKWLTPGLLYSVLVVFILSAVEMPLGSYMTLSMRAAMDDLYDCFSHSASIFSNKCYIVV